MAGAWGVSVRQAGASALACIGASGVIVGVSPAIRRVRDLLARYGPTSWPILVSGETGTGKELVARAIHAASERRARPLVAVNCAAVPAGLLESEFFGHVRGAFTGADHTRRGLFEAAHASSLFLDEVGELPYGLQAKLLRVLDSGTYRPLGDTRDNAVDVRVIAATNRDLPQMVRAGAFRSDLYYRLAILRIDIPPLRERREDIPLLARHLLKRLVPDRAADLTPRAEAALMAATWPGNVRELLHVLLRTVLGAPAGLIDSERLEFCEADATGGDTALRQAVRAFECQHLEQVLQRHRGNKSAAARELGITYRGLVKKLRRNGMM